MKLLLKVNKFSKIEYLMSNLSLLEPVFIIKIILSPVIVGVSWGEYIWSRVLNVNNHFPKYEVGFK